MQLHIAHFSDLHYADETLQEVDRCFTYAVDEAIRERVDVAIITGDTTDHALNAHSPALAALARQIRRLADHCPVLMLQGTFSHEPPGFLSLFPLFGGKHPVHVADAIGQVALTGTGQWIASNGWRFDIPPDDMRLLCTCIPTLNKASLAAAFGPVDAAYAMGDQLARLLAGYAPGHLTVRQRDIPVVVLSHGTVHGCETEQGVPMAGADHEFTTGALFSAQASAIMLGHIHKHQVWNVDGRCIAYPGSIGRLHYGEEGDKGFLIWHVGSDCSAATLRPAPARQTYEIVFDGAPDIEALTQFAKSHELTGASVRVRWQVLEEERNVIDRARLAEILASAGSLKLEGRIIPINRTRAAGMAREHSIPRQIEQWSQVTGVCPQAILSCLDQLTRESPETIAARVLQAHGPLAIQEAVEVN
jgi:DNA repair protein SbcD/Mre11